MIRPTERLQILVVRVKFINISEFLVNLDICQEINWASNDMICKVQLSIAKRKTNRKTQTALMPTNDYNNLLGIQIEARIVHVES